jgi:uncharacterized repeat protein (TIGR02543 family)
MKKKWTTLLVIASSLLLVGVIWAANGSSINWWVMGAGGGSDSAGNLSLDSTQGQWAVGTDTAGNSEISSGFWRGLNCYTLTTTTNPVAFGTIEADPAPNCGAQYLDGTVVELTAVSNTGYQFDDWSGDASGTDNPVSVAMDGDKSVTANFSETTQPCYALSTAVDPAGSGSVEANPAPNCGSEYVEGTAVTVTAVANTGYTFDSWTGGASGTDNPTTVTMNGARSVTAHFGLVCHTLTVGVSPGAAGSVTADPSPNCASDYIEGTVVTLTATANTGYAFDNWSGAVSSTDNPIQITINTDKNVTANFSVTSQTCYAMTLTAEPPEGGTIQANPTPNCGGDYLQGTVVTVTAVANTGYSFTHWNGDIGGTDNPHVVTMNGPINVEAYFRENFDVYLPLIMRNIAQ